LTSSGKRKWKDKLSIQDKKDHHLHACVMSVRLPKEVTARLYRYVSKFDIAFHPFGGKATRGVRELMVRTDAAKMRKMNPKLIVNKDIHYVPLPRPPVRTFIYTRRH